jgi:succinate dehydrogenase/fumarate reductase cytochrome b subunit (b558 family)
VSESTAATSLFDKSKRPYLLRKLHSLSGIIPVGGFMCFHLWENSNALQGQERFEETVQSINRMPYVWILEWAMILLPLLFHAGYGVKIALEGKPNVRHYTFSRNWMYSLQRVTGLVAFAFILFHLYEFWFQKLTGKVQTEQFYGMLCEHMSSMSHGVPLYALIYIIGIAACTFHFANGLWGFCFSWGITVSRRSQQLAATAFGVLGLLVFLLGANTAIYFATGSRFAIGMSDKARTCGDSPVAAH